VDDVHRGIKLLQLVFDLVHLNLDEGEEDGRQLS